MGNSKLVRFRRNDWLKGKNEIYKSYVSALAGSTKSIVIVASYFLPGIRFRRLLKKAAMRGVDIRIILAGKSDVASVRLAESYLYDFYLKNKIRIYEWSNSVMHGKAMAVDGEWATIGSYNLNYLSHHISIELNADIIDPGFLDQFSTHLEEIMREHCVEISHEEVRKAGWFTKLKMWLAYAFFKLLKEIFVSKKKYKEKE
jgi:cardiolipin synthase